jgi:hypothetical protein
MWLELTEDNDLIVYPKLYIRSQPVKYEQIRGTIEQLSEPVNAYIDLNGLNIWRINYVGLVRIIWTLHKETENKGLLKKIYFINANETTVRIWKNIKGLLPWFVQDCVVFLYA